MLLTGVSTQPATCRPGQGGQRRPHRFHTGGQCWMCRQTGRR